MQVLYIATMIHDATRQISPSPLYRYKLNLRSENIVNPKLKPNLSRSYQSSLCIFCYKRDFKHWKKILNYSKGLSGAPFHFIFPSTICSPSSVMNILISFPNASLPFLTSWFLEFLLSHFQYTVKKLKLKCKLMSQTPIPALKREIIFKTVYGARSHYFSINQELSGTVQRFCMNDLTFISLSFWSYIHCPIGLTLKNTTWCH